jgi:hypothetical protein
MIVLGIDTGTIRVDGLRETDRRRRPVPHPR